MKYYYGVMYFKSYNMGITKPKKSPEKVMEFMKDYIRNHPGKVWKTTWIQREIEPDEAHIPFGGPKSRDLLANKKFVKEITR